MTATFDMVIRSCARSFASFAFAFFQIFSADFPSSKSSTPK
jgi:hypothetical protein